MGQLRLGSTDGRLLAIVGLVGLAPNASVWPAALLPMEQLLALTDRVDPRTNTCALSPNPIGNTNAFLAAIENSVQRYNHPPVLHSPAPWRPRTTREAS
jgi:hypothetical protein